MADLLIYSDIGEWFDGVSAKSVSKELDAISLAEKQLTVRINSPGGSVSDGIAIRNILRSFAMKRRAFDSAFKLVVIVDGFAYSAASIIAMAGDEIIMNQGSLMMIHRAWTWAMGNSQELIELSNYLSKIDGELADLYAVRSGMKKEEVLALMNAETYFTAKEAVAAKLADREDESSVADLAKHELFAKQPSNSGTKYCELMKPRLTASKQLAARAGGKSTQEAAPDMSWMDPFEIATAIDTLCI